MKKNQRKTTNRRNQRKSATALEKLGIFQRISAHVTEEQGWDSEGPKMKVSRAFGVFLLLHIVAVLGLIAFELARDKTKQTPTLADAEKKEAADRAAAKQLAKRAKPKAPKIEYKQHRIAPNETLDSLAAHYGIRKIDILQANDLPESWVPSVSQSIKIPVPVKTPKRPNGPAAPTKVAARPAQPARQTLPAPATPAPRVTNRPPAGAVPAATPPRQTQKLPQPKKAPAARPSNKFYKVKKGDTLYSIARRNGITAKQLMKFNNISDPSSLAIGRKLKIPAKR